MAMSLDEFVYWAMQQGSVGNPNPEQNYRGQCVSLVQQYLFHVFNEPYAPRGDAKDFRPPHFTCVRDRPQPGDIIRLHSSPMNGNYGHIGLIDSHGGFFEQNYDSRGSMRIGSIPPSHEIESIWRHESFVNRSRQTSTPISGRSSITGESFWVRVTDPQGVNVRVQPTSNSQKGGSEFLEQGSEFEAIALVKGQNVAGCDMWYQSKKGNYVWAKNCKKI